MSPSRTPRLLAASVTAGLALVSLGATTPAFSESGQQPSSVTAGLAESNSQVSSLVDPITIGASETADVDERTGMLNFRLSVMKLAGLEPSKGVDLGLRYRLQDTEAWNNIDRFGLGAGIAWSDMPFVDVDGGVRVHLASGESYDVDPNLETGLSQYPLEDLKFETKNDSIAGVGYAYILNSSEGVDYFSAAGDLVARQDNFGATTVYTWINKFGFHFLCNVTTSWDTSVSIDWSWTATGADKAEVRSSALSNDGYMQTDLFMTDGRLTSTYEGSSRTRTNLSYALPWKGAGSPVLIAIENAATQTSTNVRYTPYSDVQSLPRVASIDGRTWSPDSIQNATGFPLYQNAQELWNSGDASYRYKTVASNGGTQRVESEYNSMGVLVSRKLISMTANGNVPVDYVVKSEELEYPGTAGGRVPQPGAVPPQYAKPIRVTVKTFEPNSPDPVTTEITQMEWDARGNMLSKVAPDGTTTETDYNTKLVLRPGFPVSEIPASLILNQKVMDKGQNGSVIRNVPSDELNAIAGSTTYAVTGDVSREQLDTQFAFDANGFTIEKRVTDFRTSPVSEKVTHNKREILTTKHKVKIVTINPDKSTTTAYYDLVTGAAVDGP